MINIPTFNQKTGKLGFFDENIEFKELQDNFIPIVCKNIKEFQICQVTNVENDSQRVAVVAKVNDKTLFIMEYNFDFTKNTEEALTLFAY